MSVSTTASSLRKESIGSTQSTGSQWSGSSNTPPSQGGRLPSFKSEGNISPLHEDSEHEVEQPDTGIHLDTNFDDMDDIVDQNLAGVRPHTFGTMGPHDASMYHAHGASTPNAAAAGGVPRNVLEANNGQGQFTEQNPFGGPNPPDVSPGGTPLSPYQVSPKHSIHASTAPRRPSQLRNMRFQSIDSENSDVSSMGGPIAPSWAQGMTGDATMFNNPFERQGSITSIPEGGVPPMSPGMYTSPGAPEPPSLSSSLHGTAPSISPFAGLAASAAWAAPESWGVEQDDDAGDEDSDSSSGTEGEWGAHDGDHVLTPTADGALSDAEGQDPGMSPVKQRAMSIWPLKGGGRHGEDKGPLVSLEAPNAS
jgi:adenylate cyclase